MAAIHTAMVTIPTATAIRTVTVMATAMGETNTAATTSMAMATVKMAMATVNTARPLTPESPNCSADSHAPVIIMARSTAFWARRRVEQSARTSGTTGTQATDRISFAYRRDDSVDFNSSTGGFRKGVEEGEPPVVYVVVSYDSRLAKGQVSRSSFGQFDSAMLR